jgi:hypothetical protein
MMMMSEIPIISDQGHGHQRLACQASAGWPSSRTVRVQEEKWYTSM